MSRQNKVNPGMYTQRGRLTQDDASRELRKQSAIRSPHTWQPVNTRTVPQPGPAGDAARATERSADNERVETSPQVETRPARRVTRNTTASKATPANTRAKAAKAKSAASRTSKRTAGSAKTGKAMTAAMKQTTKPARKAMLARNVGGRGAAPRPTRKR